MCKIFKSFKSFAREWISPAAVTWMLNELVENEAYGYLLEKLDWYFLPVHNPDGYAYTHLSPEKNKFRYWRGNRNNTCVCLVYLKT